MNHLLFPRGSGHPPRESRPAKIYILRKFNHIPYSRPSPPWQSGHRSTFMISAAKLDANRENATHSTGPQTADGKSRSRLNGLRHGLTGQTVVMPFECRKAYERHTARIIDALQPAGDLERDLAQSIADDKWRLHRAGSIEENLFAIGAEDCPVDYPDADRSGKLALIRSETFIRFSKEFQLLTLYESRITRNLKNNTAELARLQTLRREEEARQLEEASLLAELAESKG